MRYPLIVLDRDGTIVTDKHYLKDPDQLEFLPNAVAGLQHMAAAGFHLVVVSNQSGIARGLMTVADVDAVNARLAQMLQADNVRLDGIYYCPHGPNDHYACRKPGAQLLYDACDALQMPHAAHAVIGDKESDILLGRTVGARTILIRGPANDREATRADYVVDDLLQAAHILQS